MSPSSVLLKKLSDGAYDARFARLYGEEQVAVQRARYADAVHPNTDGFACYAQALAGAIRAADKKKGRNQK